MKSHCSRSYSPTYVLTFLLFVGLLSTASLAQAPPQPPASQRGTLTILPEAFLRGYDPVTLFFPQPAGPASGPEDHSERLVKMEPDQPGEYRWVDSRTLIFKPTVPWPPLERFKITAGGKTKSLATLMVPPSKLDPPDGALNLDPVEEVTLTFKEPIAKEKLASMVTFELRPLPGVDKKAPRWLTSEDYVIKAMERASANESASFAFRFKRPIEDGLRAIVHLRLSLDDDSKESFAEYSFSTKEPFRILAAGCLAGEVPQARPETRRENAYAHEETGAEGEEAESESAPGEEEGRPEEPERPAYRKSQPPPKAMPGLLPMTLAGTSYTKEQAVNGGTGTPRVAVQFSSDLEPLTLSAVKSLVRFTPSLSDMSFSQSGPYLYITGKVLRDTVYEATLLPAAVHDASGRLLRLDGPSQFFFYFPKQSPYLRWAQSQGIVERYGPQMFPMSGRGDSRVDLRIYKVDPLDRNFWPFPQGPASVDESARPPGPGEEPPDATSFNHYVTPADLSLRLKMLSSPPVSRIVQLPLRKESGAATFGLSLKEHLADISGPDAPGTYLVGVRRLNEDNTRQFVRIQVTDLCLSTIEEERAVQFLVTSLKTGLPVSGAVILVEGIRSCCAYQPLIQGSTDERGLFRYEHRSKLDADIKRITVKSGSDTLVLLPTDPPYAFANNHWYGPRGKWLGWLEGDPLPEPDVSQKLMAHIYTERPVYRPEEEVHVKGYLRVRDKGRLKLPPTDKYELVIKTPGDKEFNCPVDITPEGSFYYKFQEKELPSGTYNAVLHNIQTNTSYGKVDWKMEAYRIPRFEVDIHGPDKAPMDKEFSLTATASYYAGGRVVGQPVLWRVTQFPFAYIPEKREGFLFSSDERFSRAGRFQAPGALEKQDKTDDSGASVITVNPALEIDARPRRYVFEVTVTGPDEQTVSSTRQVLALPPFILGLKVDRFLKNAKTIRPEIIALDGDNQFIKDQEITVRLLLRQWHSTLTETDFATGKAKYVTDVVDKEIFKSVVKTDVKPVTADLPAEKAGIYVVELSSRDRLGRLQVVSVDLYVGGPEALAWKKPEAGVFETNSDKVEYAPGETAQILLKSPYQQAHVVAVVEGPDGNLYQELGVTGGKAVFPLLVKNEYNPRVPVHFLLMRGRISEHSSGSVDLGKPGTMAATCWLKVNPVGNQMSVELAHPEKALPGQEITVQIKLSTPDGKPLPGEVTLWLVDQAVLALGKEKRLDPLPSFIRDVVSRLGIHDTRNKTIGEIITEESPGGGGTEEEPGLLGRVTVRKEFKTVPYYNPRIMVDKSGVAKVTFKLSDDLTNFKIRAIACSGEDRFGFAKSSIAVRLPVIVQPALPRFVRVGDSFAAGGIGRIVEGEGGNGRCEVQVEGAVLTGDTSKPLTWVKDKPERLYWPMKAVAPKPHKGQSATKGELTVRIAVQRESDKASDAFEVRIPVLPDRDPVRIESFKKLEPGTPLDFPAIKEPARDGTARQTLLITDQEALLKMLTGLDYLYEYPHLCTEQRVSQSYPVVALGGLFNAFKLEQNKEKMQEILTYTFDYLGKTLQPNGLYAYWPGQRGYVSLTAYVVEFLSEAKRAGYQFPPKLLEKPVAALKEALRSDYSGFIDGYAFMERCEALCALSAAGEFDESYGSELARKAGYLDLYSESQVLLAYNEGQKGGDTLIAPLRKDLWDNTLFKLREGKEVYGGLQSRIKTWGGLVCSSEIKTQAGIIRALYPQEEKNPKMKLMVDDLIEAGAKDGWGNTNTNAAALLALRDVVKAPRTFTKGWDFEVASGEGKQALRLDKDQPTAFYTTADPRPAKLTWTNGSAGESLFARFTLSYLPLAMGETVAAKNDGFVVRREVVRVPKDASVPPEKEWLEKEGRTLTFKVGDVVEEHIQVINPEERHFVAVVAPFAAGMEPMNPSLATAPKEAQPSGGLTLEPSYAMYLDDEVRFYYETLPSGTYDFYFRIRATTEGSFTHPAAHAEMMYQGAVHGNSVGAKYAVHKKEGN